MKLDKFKQLIEDIKALQDKSTQLYKIGVDIHDLVLDPYWGVINNLLKEIYGEQGEEWISWWCFDNDFGKKGHGAWDEAGNVICQDVESLWKHIEKLKSRENETKF